jgi:hypothetical protein
LSRQVQRGADIGPRDNGGQRVWREVFGMGGGEANTHVFVDVGDAVKEVSEPSAWKILRLGMIDVIKTLRGLVGGGGEELGGLG